MVQPALFDQTRELWGAILPDTPIGPLWVAVSEQGLAQISVGLPFETSGKHHPPAHLAHALDQLSAYFQGRRQEFDLEIDWRGIAPFNLRALRAARAIPYGQTRTYAHIAAQLGSPRASRAVGAAMAGNPMPIVLPCHRVIGSDGKLHGYAAPDGIQTKAYLLRFEGGLRMNGERS